MFIFYQQSSAAAEQYLGLSYVANHVLVIISGSENKYSTAEDLNTYNIIFQIKRLKIRFQN